MFTFLWLWLFSQSKDYCRWSSSSWHDILVAFYTSCSQTKLNTVPLFPPTRERGTQISPIRVVCVRFCSSQQQQHRNGYRSDILKSIHTNLCVCRFHHSLTLIAIFCMLIPITCTDSSAVCARMSLVSFFVLVDLKQSCCFDHESVL